MTFRTLAHGVVRLNTDPMRPTSHGTIIPYREASPARTRFSLRALIFGETK